MKRYRLVVSLYSGATDTYLISSNTGERVRCFYTWSQDSSVRNWAQTGPKLGNSLYSLHQNFRFLSVNNNFTRPYGDIASSGQSPKSSWHNIIVFADYRSLQENQSMYDVPVTRIFAFSYRLPSQTYSNLTASNIHLWWTPDGHHEMCDYSGTRRIFRIQVCIRNRVHT